MDALFLSFRTADAADEAEWSRTALAILHKLGDGLESIGFAIDYEPLRHDPDWVFEARRGKTVFRLYIGIANFTPCRWFIGLEDSESENLQLPEVRQEVHPVLQSVIESWPHVSEIRWHKDHTSLRELSSWAGRDSARHQAEHNVAPDGVEMIIYGKSNDGPEPLPVRFGLRTLLISIAMIALALAAIVIAAR
jgi:hypothetical protein